MYNQSMNQCNYESIFYACEWYSYSFETKAFVKIRREFKYFFNKLDMLVIQISRSFTYNVNNIHTHAKKKPIRSS